MQLTYYGYQLPDVEDKNQVKTAVSDLVRTLKGITKLNCGNNVAQAQKYLKGVHNRAKKYENQIKALLDQARISSTAYGTPAFNTNTILGINFADELITKANNMSAVVQELSFIIHNEDDESVTLSATEIEKLLNDPKSTVTYQVVLPGQMINEDGWRDLTTQELEDLKKDNKGILYANITSPNKISKDKSIQGDSNQPGMPRGPELEPDDEDKNDLKTTNEEAQKLLNSDLERLKEINSKAKSQRLAQNKMNDDISNSRYVNSSKNGRFRRTMPKGCDPLETDLDSARQMNLDMWAEKRYQEIRGNKLDVEKISQNTSWPKEEIQRIKDHLFHQKHYRRIDISRDGKEIYGTKSFDANPEIADAWDRLFNGDFIENDLQLLSHEYYELRYMKYFNASYNEAHRMTLTIPECYWNYPY